MIRFLSIQNLAVIEEIQIELDAGLNVLTGETGAGKSIVVEALGLLMGGRASPNLVRTGETKALIQASIEDAAKEEFILRREVSSEGRSRAFINGNLTTISALKELTGRLVDLHGQHEHESLLDPKTHLVVLDRYATLTKKSIAVSEAYGCFQKARKSLERTIAAQHDKAARLELLEFQLSEIGKICPLVGEDQRLNAARKVLMNAEQLQRLRSESYVALYEGEDAILTLLERLWKRVRELADLDPRFVPYVEMKEEVKVQLEDLAFFLRSFEIDIDPSLGDLQQVEDRLVLLERLKKKYGKSLNEIIARQSVLKAEVLAIDNAAGRMSVLEQDLEEIYATYLNSAKALSASRKTAAKKMCSELEKLLEALAMKGTRFDVRFKDTKPSEETWTGSGIDQVVFYLSPNPGEELRPLSKVASGGELSRIMLGLKTLASTDEAGKTLIFDEVDAGIGGRAADTVGQNLSDLGEKFQVLCVTHLPQIAAYAGTHYRVEKTVQGGRTLTTVERLKGEKRVEELARLMTGTAVSSKSRASARELLSMRSRNEEKANT